MEKENKKGQVKYLKDERARIFKFVEMARKNHPMMIKEEKEIEAEKARVKLEKFNFKKNQRDVLENAKKAKQDAVVNEAQAKKDADATAKAEKKLKDLAMK